MIQITSYLTNAYVLLYYYYYYQFFQRRVTQKAKLPVQGGPHRSVLVLSLERTHVALVCLLQVCLCMCVCVCVCMCVCAFVQYACVADVSIFCYSL